MTGGRLGNQIHSGESSNRVVNEFYVPPDKVKNLHKYGQGYFIYRGDNSQKCVNFGCFADAPEVLYKRKLKMNKREGLGLFEKYYVNFQEKPPELKPDSPPQKKSNEEPDLGDKGEHDENSN